LFLILGWDEEPRFGERGAQAKEYACIFLPSTAGRSAIRQLAESAISLPLRQVCLKMVQYAYA
jgi:hypothetical protein